MYKPGDELPEGTVGLELRGVYDGVVIWMLPDGTNINRWANVQGMERVAKAAQEHIDNVLEKDN